MCTTLKLTKIQTYPKYRLCQFTEFNKIWLQKPLVQSDPTSASPKVIFMNSRWSQPLVRNFESNISDGGSAACVWDGRPWDHQAFSIEVTSCAAPPSLPAVRTLHTFLPCLFARQSSSGLSSSVWTKLYTTSRYWPGRSVWYQSVQWCTVAPSLTNWPETDAIHNIYQLNEILLWWPGQV